MQTFFGVNSDSVGTLLSSISNNSATSFSGGGILSEYYNIKSGTYRKVLDAYYSKIDKSSETTTNKNTAISKDSSKTLSNIKENADSLKNSSNDLLTDDSKDLNSIYKKASSFIDGYNKMLSSSNSSSSTSIKNAVRSLKSYTDSNKQLLGKAGITISDDGKLSINKSEFLESNVSDVKTLFNGRNSYAYNVAGKASMVSGYADIEASRSNTYSLKGGYTYNYSTGDIVNSIV